MRMRTIRWCNGQCPGRNGQWAERIAHAGSGAVRLVPFSAAAVFPRILRSPALLALRVLLPLLLIQLDRFHHGLSGMAELRDVSRYRGEFFQLIACRQRTSLGALGGTPQNSLFSGSVRAALEQQPEWFEVRAFLRTLAAESGRGCRD